MPGKDCKTGGEVFNLGRGILDGGGLSGARLRSLDWKASPLGEPSNWPQGLLTAVRLMLGTRHPVMIFWGPDAIHLFNDAAGHLIGAEGQEKAMAQPGAIALPGLWDVFGPQFDRVMAGGSASWHENQLLPTVRRGRPHGACWTYSCGPIDDAVAPNGVGGVMVVAMDTTEILLAERWRAAEAERVRASAGLLSAEERLRNAGRDLE